MPIYFFIASCTAEFGLKVNIDYERTTLKLILFFLSFPQLCPVPRAIPESLEPINVQTDVQRQELSCAAGSSSLNPISTAELHFRHHGPYLLICSKVTREQTALGKSHVVIAVK